LVRLAKREVWGWWVLMRVKTLVWWWWWWELRWRLCLDMSCGTSSVAVAESSYLCRLCVKTSVNHGHLLEDEREGIRGGVES
jgi:hypothetical protein